MSVFGMSEEEKKRILEKHKDATKNHYVKKQETKEGLKKPEENKEEKELLEKLKNSENFQPKLDGSEKGFFQRVKDMFQ